MIVVEKIVSGVIMLTAAALVLRNSSGVDRIIRSISEGSRSTISVLLQ